MAASFKQYSSISFTFRWKMGVENNLKEGLFVDLKLSLTLKLDHWYRLTFEFGNI